MDAAAAQPLPRAQALSVHSRQARGAWDLCRLQLMVLDLVDTLAEVRSPQLVLSDGGAWVEIPLELKRVLCIPLARC